MSARIRGLQTGTLELPLTDCRDINNCGPESRLFFQSQVRVVTANIFKRDVASLTSRG